MTKTFRFEVAGQEREDSKAWGSAWEWAKEFARETGSEVRRTVIDLRTEKERYEFFASGGAFLSMEFYAPEKAMHF